MKLERYTYITNTWPTAFEAKLISSTYSFSIDISTAFIFYVGLGNTPLSWM